jgi:hypothetical protein
MVTKDGRALEYVHEDLKKDPEIVTAAVRQNGNALKWAHGDLKKNPEIVIAAVLQNGDARKWAHEELYALAGVVMAVRSDATLMTTVDISVTSIMRELVFEYKVLVAYSLTFDL